MVRHFFLKDWEDSITGVVLLENSEWVLIADIPADFVIDGYQLIQKKELYDHQMELEEAFEPQYDLASKWVQTDQIE